LLKFVVDAPVHFSELEWAQKNARFPRTDWGRAFSSIRYNFGRITSQAYDWDDSPYTLDAIETAGGICVDQAYFAVIAGKARGLPTLFFTGQGVDGGHAWFGYLRSENRWDMDCGRYENQNYAVGEALDPQSWLPISDHDLQSLAKSFRRQTTYVAARNDLVMARMFEDAGDLPKALACAESAIATSPQTPEAWEAVAHLLRRSNAPASRQIAHHEAALKQFQTENDLRFKNQTALAALLRETGEAARAEQLETKIISQNRLKRSDLSVRAGAERLASLIAAGNIDTALREYRGLLSRLGPTAGGNVFYQIVRPLVKELHRTGRSSEALKALNQARTTINPERDSILEQELVKLEASLSSPSTDP
jgi:tetratricopeptide (TPR) repeat protein